MRILWGSFGAIFGGVVNIPTYVSANFLWNYLIFEAIFYFSFWFRPWTKKSTFEKKSWLLITFILRAQKNFSGRKSFSLIRSFFMIVFGLWETCFQRFDKHSFSRQSILHSILPEHFEDEKQGLWEKKMIV